MMPRPRHTRVLAVHGAPATSSGSVITLTVPEETRLAGAVCTRVVPEVFFTDDEDGEQLAKRICAVCPVRAACLDLAVARKERYGVFGGLTPAERDDLAQLPSRCGTRRGYIRHRGFAETPCDACRAANAADSAARRANKARPAGQEGSSLEAAA